jgi:hypothetical protein
LAGARTLRRQVDSGPPNALSPAEVTALVRNISSSTAAGEQGGRYVSERAGRASTDFARELGRAGERQGRMVRSSASETPSQNETAASAGKPAAELAVSLAPNPFNPAGGVVKPAVTAAAAPTPPAAAPPPAAPIDILKKQLEQMGISSAGLQFAETRTVVGYPGGSYVNHTISVDFGGGVAENYDVGLMLRNPWLTAFEIDRLRKAPHA